MIYDAHFHLDLIDNMDDFINALNVHLEPKERSNYLNQKMESDKLITNYKNSMVLSTDLLKDSFLYPDSASEFSCYHS